MSGDLADRATENLASGMASQYDAIICAALGMSEKEVLAIAKGRLARAVIGDLETVLLDGEPLVTFWPIETRTEVAGCVYNLVSSRKYIVHNQEGGG